MAITGVRWVGDEGFDIHVLEGKTSHHLDARLEVLYNGVWLTNQPADPNDPASKLPSSVKFKFVPEVAASPASLGLTVDAAVGSVLVTKPRPAYPLRVDNFLLRAEVSEGGPPFATTPRIRVHVHESLVGAKVWLAPRQLTLRASASRQHFSVLALFDDGTIGDLTYSPDLRWSKGAGDSVTLDTFSGALTGASIADKGTITVKLPNWDGVTASAPVTTRLSWEMLGKAGVARFLGGPGKARAASVPNVLLLPEGFDDANQTTFEALTTEVVRRLRTDQRSSPFDLLLQKGLNIWAAWIPSTDKGVTVGTELAVNSRSGAMMGYELPVARPPDPATPVASWSIDELIYKVGLPVYGDLIDQDESDLTLALSAAYLRRLMVWSQVYGVTGTTITQYRDWCDRADRGIANDRDSGLGLTFGGRPNYDVPVPPQRLGLHPLRVSREDLNPFLAALSDVKNGPPLGFWGKTGKDKDLVYTFVAGIRHGGTHVAELSASSLGETSEVVVKPGPQGGRSLDLVDPKMVRAPSLTALMVLVHEMCHAFKLGDEYGQRGVIPDATLAQKGVAFNLEGRADLLDGAQLSGAKLKWLWPRMTKVTFTTGTITSAGSGRFTIPYQPFAAGEPGFGAGEVVQLRARTLVPGVSRSDTWKVVPGPVAADKVTIERAGTGTALPTAFPQGSLLYAPRLDPAAPAGSIAPLLLVHKKISDHITAKHQPLNAPKTATASRVCSDGPENEPVQQPTNLPDGLTKPADAYWAWVVGAYEGGAHYRCGVYHPTGACAMRDANITMKRVGGNKYEEWIITLCAVCRYALVDQLDPTQHGRVDDWLTKRYPK